MDQLELHNRIIFLVPDAKFSTWACKPEHFQGEGKPIEMGDYLVAWNSTNATACPSWDDVQKVDIDSLNKFIEDNRKKERNAFMAKDMAIIAGFKVAQTADVNLSFSDYLDSLEEEQSTINIID